MNNQKIEESSIEVVDVSDLKFSEDGKGDPKGAPWGRPGCGERIGSRYFFFLPIETESHNFSPGDSVEKLLSHSLEVLGVQQIDMEGVKMLSGWTLSLKPRWWIWFFRIPSQAFRYQWSGPKHRKPWREKWRHNHLPEPEAFQHWALVRPFQFFQ